MLPGEFLKEAVSGIPLLFVGDIHSSVIVWKNAQSLHYVTLKERKFPNEKQNKAGCNRGKWNHFHYFREQLFLILPLLRCENSYKNSSDNDYLLRLTRNQAPHQMSDIQCLLKSTQEFWGRYYYWAHFTDEKVEWYTGTLWLSRYSNLNLSDSEVMFNQNALLPLAFSYN